MLEKKYSKLAKNTALFVIGNFSSKILTFLIVPLYTYVLTTEEYGRIDLFSTTISFMLPIITLSIQEAMIRYILGNEMERDVVISNCWCIYVVGVIVSLLFYPIYKMYFKTSELSILFVITLIEQSFFSMFSHYLRCVGKNIAYTISGILATVSILVSNLFLLLVLKWGMAGYLYSGIISLTITNLYIIIVGGLWKKLSFKCVKIDLLKKMILFSAPLIPNSLMWWIMSAGDKYIINYFLDDSANGLYSLALKVPTVISMFCSIFFQAWQMSAIEENNSERRKQFYEEVFKLTNALLMCLMTCIIMGIKPLYVLVMNEKFAKAWIYVPFLCLGTAFSCQSSFFGVVYMTSEKTSKAFITTALGALMNLLFNFIFIMPFGLQGVAIGTCLGYVVVCFVRARDVKKEIQMEFDLTRTVSAVVIVIMQGTITMLGSNLVILGIGIISVLLIFLLYRTELVMILKVIISRFCKTRGI